MTLRPILLDTCAAIWIANGSRLSVEAEAALQEAQHRGRITYISPITAWEVGQLVARGRLALSLPPDLWFEAFTASGMQLGPMPPGVLVGSSFLPGPALRDPADRILAATARTFDFRLMTRDRPLLEFANAGHVQAIAC